MQTVAFGLTFHSYFVIFKKKVGSVASRYLSHNSGWVLRIENAWNQQTEALSLDQITPLELPIPIFLNYLIYANNENHLLPPLRNAKNPTIFVIIIVTVDLKKTLVLLIKQLL